MKRTITAVLSAMMTLTLVSCTSVSEKESLGEYSFLQNSFSTFVQAEHLKWNSKDISVSPEGKRGIRISGDNAQLAETRFSIENTYDFEEESIQRIQITGTAEEGTSAKVSVYLDGQKEPAAVITLSDQPETNGNAVVSDTGITGKHTVEFSVCTYSADGTAAKGNTEVVLKGIQFVKETVPLVIIEIDESKGTIDEMNSDPDHNTRCYGDVTIAVQEGYAGSYDTSYTGGTYELDYIKGRGNSTWHEGGKHPYKIKLDDSADLFGMGENKHWALIANEFDETMARNAFTYLLGEELGMEYTPQAVSVDVIMNDEYLGSYLLCENIRVDENRIELEDPDDTDFTGGYLLGASHSGADEENYLFVTKHLFEFNVTYPVSEDPDEYAQQNAYIEAFIQRVEDAIYGSGEDVFELMDLDSAVRYFWVQELSRNEDFFSTGSTYCYKVKDGKLYWGPLWDFDIAWAEGTFDESSKWAGDRGWFRQLLKNDIFREAAVSYLKDELIPVMNQVMAEGGMFDELIERISYSAVNNHMRWGYRWLEETEGADYDDMGTGFYADQKEARKLYQNKVEKLRNAIRGRTAWCSEHTDSMRPEDISVVFRANGETVYEAVGSMNENFVMIPEVPESADPEMEPAGWYCYYTGSGFYYFREVEDKVCLAESNCIQTENGYVFCADAVYRKKGEEPAMYQSVSFEKDQYEISLRDGETLIPYTGTPENGSCLGFHVMVDFADLVDLRITDEGILVKPLAAGTAVLDVMTDESDSCIELTITE